MEISGSSSVSYAAQAQRVQQLSQSRAAQVQPVQPAGYDGPDVENDGDRDDGSVTATRGNQVNILA